MSVELREDISQVTFLLGETKKKFEEYITNREIPLEERWELFVTAPDYLKEHEGSVAHFKVLDDNDVEFYDDLYLEKYQTVTSNCLVDRVQDLLDEGKFEDIKIEELQEEILLKNLGSFTNDW